MRSAEFVSKLLDIEKKYKTVYGWGTFGWPWDASALARVTKQYPGFYTAAKQAQLRQFFGKGYYSFDCVGLIKGVLWGWSGNAAKTYGGAIYATNGVPDIDANVMKNRCSGISSDFSKIVPGEIVWMPGHIGVYIGGGKAVECTPAWENGVQITAVLNIGAVPGLKGRRWTSHGRLPYISYDRPDQSSSGSASTIKVGTKVRIVGDNAQYTTGGKIPAWAKSIEHSVTQINGEKALLGSPDGIRSWVYMKDLQIVI